jgi:two-component system response regulator RegX3
MSERILLVDDDAGVRDVVAFPLRREGFEVDEERDGPGALEAGRTGGYDLVILDVMLPGLSGVEVCRALRAESDVPILMLTARDAEADRVLGLETGADDYVTKPFSSAELLSRVRAILRRRELDRSAASGAGGNGTVRELGGLKLDLGRHEVTVDGERVHLTLSEFKVLSLLAEQPDAVISRRELMQHLWGSEYVGDEHACEVHISNLRRKIERDPTQPERLLTVRGEGYKLVAA